MFVISRGPVSKENKEYFADVQVFFVRTKPLCLKPSPNTGCLLGLDDSEPRLSATCSEDCVLGLGVGKSSKWERAVNKKRSCFLHLHMCTCEGPHGLFLKSSFGWDLGGHTNIALPNKHEAVSLLHSFAITGLVLSPLWNSSFIHFGLSCMAGEINQTKKSL